MPKATALPDDEIERRLTAHPDWVRRGTLLARTFTFRVFREALAFVNRVADEADAQDHHPDVHIHWNEVTFELWTHASNAITERDFRLAEAIDRIAEV
jgi:4a-hydroxytetrahydrobiopterin dehydratase